MTLQDRARTFVAAIPHCAALGISVEEVSAARAVLTLPYDPRLVGDPATGVIAGGAVSVLMDTACGAAVMAHPEAQGATATIDLRIDYFRAATPGQRLIAEAECHHVTAHVAFVRATTFDADMTRPVATATGTFTVVRDGA
ncbi:PaaI family thioesterase [Falsirhodobacter halotolerans]|uniref:PaaI family thioesterase n=1 Tax=Falsirhodobacter halotolerans TaxID=1146892 RepID=UPI001FD0928C|nr:PaaI family thioesterase [Falsirhodobacter halotolerans]MCJ8140379.1 PaaI family thioesterase [Falsirhodobacter halotolerans]